MRTIGKGKTHKTKARKTEGSSETRHMSTLNEATEYTKTKGGKPNNVKGDLDR